VGAKGEQDFERFRNAKVFIVALGRTPFAAADIRQS
jgi:hypothetical protein